MCWIVQWTMDVVFNQPGDVYESLDLLTSTCSGVHVLMDIRGYRAGVYSAMLILGSSIIILHWCLVVLSRYVFSVAQE